MEGPGSYLDKIQGSCLCFPTGRRKSNLGTGTLDSKSGPLHPYKMLLWTLMILTNHLLIQAEPRWGILSKYFLGNWTGEFDFLMDQLRVAIIRVNSTRVDAPLSEGLSAWVTSAMNLFKEWAGVTGVGMLLCDGVVFCSGWCVSYELNRIVKGGDNSGPGCY